MPSNFEHFCSSHGAGAQEYLHVQQPTLPEQDRGSKTMQDIDVPVLLNSLQANASFYRQEGHKGATEKNKTTLPG